MKRSSFSGAALMVAVVLASTSCGLGGFSRPSLSLRGVQITHIDFQELGANFVFNVDNPNPIGIDLARLAYQLSIEGHPLVGGNGGHTLHVPARGIGTLVLPVTLRYLELARAVSSLFQKSSVAYQIRTRLGFGTPIGIIDVPLDASGRLPVPQFPEVRLAAAGLTGLSLGAAGIAVTVVLHNRNGFAVPLGALGYTLRVAGVPVAGGSAAPGSLAANASVAVPIGARVNFASVGLAVARAIASRAATLSLDGQLGVGGFALPVHLATTLR